VDLAEFFTLAHTLEQSPALFEPHTSSALVKGIHLGSDAPSESTLFQDLAAVVRTFFCDIGILYEPPADMDGVLGRVKSNRDVIINFNWDEEVDVALCRGSRPGVTYTYDAWRSRPRTILSLKPHGSIGWYDVKQGIGNTD